MGKHYYLTKTTDKIQTGSTSKYQLPDTFNIN